MSPPSRDRHKKSIVVYTTIKKRLFSCSTNYLKKQDKMAMACITSLINNKINNHKKLFKLCPYLIMLCSMLMGQG
jgi:hypothetical protein